MKSSKQLQGNFNYNDYFQRTSLKTNRFDLSKSQYLITDNLVY